MKSTNKLFRNSNGALYCFFTGILIIAGCSKSADTNERPQEPKLMKIESGQGEETFKGFKINIEKSTVENKDFRKVLYTARHLQVVLMSLKPGEAIGEEIHSETDQFFRVEAGKGKCIIDGTSYEVQDGDALVVPAGARHNFINTDKSNELKLYTLYSPPHHKDGIVRKTKEEAKVREEEFDGKTTEKSRN